MIVLRLGFVDAASTDAVFERIHEVGRMLTTPRQWLLQPRE